VRERRVEDKKKESREGKQKNERRKQKIK